MQIGIVGLGRMGANMAKRLRQGGHDVVGMDPRGDARDPDHDVASLEELVQRLDAPRAVWMMVPAGEVTEQTVTGLLDLLEAGDLVVDGGNSRHTDSVARARRLAERDIGFVDVGVSGGVWGLAEGYGLMAGGSPEDYARVEPVLQTLKPEGDSGLVHAGPVGAGHYAKMVHNGVEYGLMQAYAEGYELLAASDYARGEGLAEGAEQLMDVAAVVDAWRAGTVIRSWLLDLLARALQQDPGLAEIRGWAADSGEGRWTVAEAVDKAVPLPVISAALFARFASRQDDSPAMKVVAALRNQFGGHAVEAAHAGQEADSDASAEPATPRSTSD